MDIEALNLLSKERIANYRKHILLTGATGFVGREILTGLIKRFPESKIVCIVRATPQQTPQQRINNIVKHHNVVAFKGDITEDIIGLSTDDYQYCINHINTIIHCAASTKFNAPMEFLKKHNIDSTGEMVNLAKKINIYRKIHPTFLYVSTAYQAGKSNTFIEEGFISKPILGFKNNYEKSKWLSEQLIKEQLEYGQFLIFRPSIIMAHESGKCSADGVGIGVFGLLNKKNKRLPSIVPVTKDLKLDFVTVDYIANSMIDILSVSNSIPSGTVFHLTDIHGGMTGKEGIKVSNQSFGIKLIGINVNIVKIVVNFLGKYTNFISNRDKKVLEAYLDYFGTNPRFEQQNLARYLQQETKTLRSSEVYSRAIEYWKININQGRKGT